MHHYDGEQLCSRGIDQWYQRRSYRKPELMSQVIGNGSSDILLHDTVPAPKKVDCYEAMDSNCISGYNKYCSTCYTSNRGADSL